MPQMHSACNWSPGLWRTIQLGWARAAWGVFVLAIVSCWLAQQGRPAAHPLNPDQWDRGATFYTDHAGLPATLERWRVARNARPSVFWNYRPECAEPSSLDR